VKLEIFCIDRGSKRKVIVEKERDEQMNETENKMFVCSPSTRVERERKRTMYHHTGRITHGSEQRVWRHGSLRRISYPR
jgi:hypothetical protein